MLRNSFFRFQNASGASCHMITAAFAYTSRPATRFEFTHWIFPKEGTCCGKRQCSSRKILPSKATQLLLDSGIRSGCWLPLAGRKRFLGTLGVCSFQESAFSQGDLE